MPQIFAILLLAVHLLAMNVAGGAPLVAAWLMTRRGGEDAAGAVGCRVVRMALEALGLGIVLGGALLLAPTPALLAAIGRFPASAYWFAGAELVFSLLCGAALLLVARSERRRPKLAWLLAVASSTNLLYHFPPLMIVLGKLAASPTWNSTRLFERRELVHLSLQPEVLAMWNHFVLASLAVAAIAALWREAGRDSHPRVASGLAAIALGATALQLPVGAWVLATSPTSVRGALLGDNVVVSLLFLAGVAAALRLMQTLAMAALGEVSDRARRAPAVWTMVVAICMTATLRASSPAGKDSDQPARFAPTTYFSSVFGSSIAAFRSPPGSLPSAISSP